jgi:predicted Zn-dependent peptidase
MHRQTEQAHLVVGSTGLPRSDDRRFALAILNNALGGGMSSRLFQEIREKRGLAYSVYSFTSQYAGAGSFGVYAGVQPNKVRDAVGIIAKR